jgi:hypothetical protein
MSGTEMIDIHSLEEALNLLSLCAMVYHQDEFLQKGGGLTIYFADLHNLADWVGKILGDKELAGAMSQELGEKQPSDLIEDISTFFRAHIGPVKDLVEQRLNQCKTGNP